MISWSCFAANREGCLPELNEERLRLHLLVRGPTKVEGYANSLHSFWAMSRPKAISDSFRLMGIRSRITSVGSPTPGRAVGLLQGRSPSRSKAGRLVLAEPINGELLIEVVQSLRVSVRVVAGESAVYTHIRWSLRNQSVRFVC